ncbi:MAG TPA: TlpA disulfide reductase family protein [Candidatus Tumulicola sp.]|nr:TlpA disulfide reductase family protein [Candidatus Tumulicola sp.]
MKRASLAATVALLATTLAAAPAPSNPVELLSRSGKPTAGFTFVPLDGAPRHLAEGGRPSVVVLFASWCSPCMQEMPRTLAEYARYRKRVDFLGIDYTDPPAMARKLIARFRIPFPVESYVPQEAQLHPTQRQTVHLPDTITASQVRSLQNQLSADTYERIVDVYRARSTMTPEHFQAYEKWMGVYFESPKQAAAQRAAESSPGIVGLPHTFVVDARGTLRYVLEGYTPSIDRVAASLKSLGY